MKIDRLFFSAFALATALVFLALRGGGRGFSLRPVILACAILGTYGMLRGLRLGIHPAALWILALGVGVQISRWTASRAAVQSFMRRSWAPAAAVFIE